MAKDTSFFITKKGANGRHQGFRVAWPKLAQAAKHDKDDSAEAKYQVTLLIPESDKETLKTLKEEVKKAIVAKGWNKTIQDEVWKIATNDEPTNQYCIFKNGTKLNERARATENTVYDFRDGHIRVKFSRKESFGRPSIVDKNNTDIAPMDIENVIRPGHRINLKASIYAYEYKGKMGVSMQFSGVQYLKEDEEFTFDAGFDTVEIDEVSEEDISLD